MKKKQNLACQMIHIMKEREGTVVLEHSTGDCIWVQLEEKKHSFHKHDSPNEQNVLGRHEQKRWVVPQPAGGHKINARQLCKKRLKQPVPMSLLIVQVRRFFFLSCLACANMLQFFPTAALLRIVTDVTASSKTHFQSFEGNDNVLGLRFIRRFGLLRRRTACSP